MDTMRINQDYTNICSILDEKLNANVARFFKHFKDYNELLWVGCTNQSKLSIIAQMFTIQSNYGQSEAGYEKIIEWVRSIFT